MSTSTHISTRPSSTTSQTAGRDKLAALHEQISDGVAALVESDGWRAMLDPFGASNQSTAGTALTGRRLASSAAKPCQQAAAG